MIKHDTDDPYKAEMKVPIKKAFNSKINNRKHKLASLKDSNMSKNSMSILSHYTEEENDIVHELCNPLKVAAVLPEIVHEKLIAKNKGNLLPDKGYRISNVSSQSEGSLI